MKFSSKLRRVTWVQRKRMDRKKPRETSEDMGMIDAVLLRLRDSFC